MVGYATNKPEQREFRQRTESQLRFMQDILGQMVTAVNKLAKRIDLMQEAIDRMRASVTRQTEVVGGVKTLIESLVQQLRDAADNPAEINAIADQLDAQTEALAKAVADNT